MHRRLCEVPGKGKTGENHRAVPVLLGHQRGGTVVSCGGEERNVGTGPELSWCLCEYDA